MQSQQLDTRIEIDRLTVTNGASGGVLKDWALHANPFAKRTDLSGNERNASAAAGGKVAVARTEFLIRERGDLDTTMRVRHKGGVFNIQHIKPLANYRGWMVLTCDTGLNDG